MDIHLLAINVGNSRLAIGTFSAGELKHVVRLDNSQRSDWEGAIRHAWEQISQYPGAAVAGASVNPPLVELVEHAVMQATGLPIEWVGKQLDLPIKVLTDAPDQTGVDRVLNIAAAYQNMEKACVVVDAGTAMTIDCCNDAGEFIGGAIAPGAGLMLKSLHEYTAKLPEVMLEVPGVALGKSTTTAIQSGVYYGIRGMVKELVEAYATELGNWPDIIATGGDSPTLFEGWELVHAVAPDLTLYGIALAYTEHHIKHGT